MEDFMKKNGSIDRAKVEKYLDSQTEKLENVLASSSTPPKQPLNGTDKSCLIS